MNRSEIAIEAKQLRSDLFELPFPRILMIGASLSPLSALDEFVEKFLGGHNGWNPEFA